MASLDDNLMELVPGKAVIYPPPEVRSIIDKTAQFIATRGGHELEDKIKEKERSNPKFCFLNIGDPYHAYYQMKITEVKEGKDDDTVREVKVDAGQKEKQKTRRKAPKQPISLEFIADTPKIAALDMDIIRLTAMFVARNGKPFMAQLAQREAKNFQFDFLRPNHSCFPYFTKLVEQYTKVLIPSADLKQKLVAKSTDKFGLLRQCMERSEWEKYVLETRREKEKEEEAEKVAFLSIDWHDFVIVQTIDFTDADLQASLPPPSSKQSLQSMPLAQRKTIMTQASEAVNNNNQDKQEEEDEDMEMD